MPRAKTIQVPVEVTTPPLRISIPDMAYLKSLAEANGSPVCAPKGVQEAKLTVMGLIQTVQDVCPKRSRAGRNMLIKALRKKRRGLFKELSLIDYTLAHDAFAKLKGYEYRQGIAMLQPQQRTIVTPTGLALLKTGKVKVNMKKGCL